MKSCRLIYRSVARPDLLENDGLQDLLEECVEHNARLGIKGLLVVSGGQILQVLEGPPNFVNEVFRNIIVDERHQDVELVTYEGQGGSHFYDWSMRLVELDQLEPAVKDLMRRKYPHDGDSIRFPDDLIHIYSLLLDAQALGPAADNG
jgi:hypothetical protein